MKNTAKLLTALSMLTLFAAPATAQVSPFVSAQVDAAAKPCIDINSAMTGLQGAQAKAIANAALNPCYEALITLDNFEKTNGAGLTPDEANYFYYVGGNLIWMTATAETIKNNGQLNPSICFQVKAAETAWGNVAVPTGSAVDLDMRNSQLRSLLLPACLKAEQRQ